MTSYTKLLIATLSLTAPLALCAGSSNTSGTQEQTEENNLIWVGPGWYSGVWFNNEEEFNEWHGNNYNHNRDHNRDQDRRDDEDRDRGGRGGGGSGGRGRGGGGGGRR